MQKIFIIGAGRSSSSLITYLLSNAQEYDWEVIVGDSSIEGASKIIDGHDRGRAIQFDVFDSIQLNNQVQRADLVISMLPASLHHYVAHACLEHGKNLLTASYVSDEIKALDQQASDKGLIFLMETGLDPGIDHMSAMHEIDRIKAEGGEIVSFKSFTGGLVAPESDTNPWNYKFTWNPKNVVLAGQGVVKFIRNGFYKYIPYNSLFTRLEDVHVKGYGDFEGYANRDSLKYIQLYDLKGIPTIFRGTLRRPGFCKAWNVFVRLGLTDDTFQMEHTEDLTYRQYLNSFLVYHPTRKVEAKLADYLNIPEDHEIMKKIAWLGLFDDEPIGLRNTTPAKVLQNLLEKKWALEPEDKDMIVMQHQFEYMKNDTLHSRQTSMVVLGDNARSTSMAKTVGLPLGIAAKLLLSGQIKAKGVQIPVLKEIYAPILNELNERFNINFFEG